MSRTRVMHLVVGGAIGGAERLLVDLVRRPERSNGDHEIALFTHDEGLRRFLEAAGVPVYDRGRSAESPWGYLARTLLPGDTAWLADLLVRRRSDVLHTHTFGSHVLGTRASIRARIAQVRTEHHVMHYADPSTAAFTRWAAARTQRFVAISEYVRRVLLKRMPNLAPRMSVAHNGIDVAHWAPMPSPDGRGKRPLRAAIVGRLTAWKRVHLAVEAAKLAGVELVVVGDGEERARLEALSRKLDARVRFAGFQADPRPHLAACDVTINTSVDEPMGLAVLESLAMERPVVAFRGGGIPEAVDAATGVLVEEPTATALAAALRGLALRRASLAAMGALGRERVRQRFEVDRMAGAYAEAYEAAVTAGPGRA